MVAFLLSPGSLFNPGSSFVLERVDTEQGGGSDERVVGCSSEGKITEETERNRR